MGGRFLLDKRQKMWYDKGKNIFLLWLKWEIIVITAFLNDFLLVVF